MGFFQRLRQRFASPKVPVIVVGTDIGTYQLIELLGQGHTFEVLFVINDDPWLHKTYMLGAQLRYANELLALVKRHHIKAVFCASQTDFHSIAASYQTDLLQLGCQLGVANKEKLPNLREFVAR